VKYTPKAIAAAKAANVIAEKAIAEGRQLTDDEQASVKAELAIVEAEKEVAAKAEESAGLLASVKALGDLEIVTGADADKINKKALDGTRQGLTPAGGSLGDTFLKSAEYKAFLSQFPNGIGEKARVGTMNAVSVTGGLKALIGSTLVPGFVPVDAQGPTAPIWGRELTIRDVITTGATSSDTVEFARLSSSTNAAAMVAEASGHSDGTTGGAVAGTKPESAIVWEKVTVTVKTVAHWLAATKRALSDAGQLKTLIDQFLRFGLEEELEDQIMAGNGSGENFDGITHLSGTQSQAYSSNVPQTIRKAITKARTVGRVRPNAVGLHPADDEQLDLLQDTTGRYFGAGPFGTGPSTVWGLPRVVSEAIPEGTAIVADWKQAVLWDREQATISVSDSHEDFFTRNLVAVLGEARAAFGVLRPSAFVLADLTA
jgi:hypothetical protein